MYRRPNIMAKKIFSLSEVTAAFIRGHLSWMWQMLSEAAHEKFKPRLAVPSCHGRDRP